MGALDLVEFALVEEVITLLSMGELDLVELAVVEHVMI